MLPQGVSSGGATTSSSAFEPIRLTRGGTLVASASTYTLNSNLIYAAFIPKSKEPSEITSITFVMLDSNNAQIKSSLLNYPSSELIVSKIGDIDYYNAALNINSDDLKANPKLIQVTIILKDGTPLIKTVQVNVEQACGPTGTEGTCSTSACAELKEIPSTQCSSVQKCCKP